jgi:hypothetical protein
MPPLPYKSPDPVIMYLKSNVEASQVFVLNATAVASSDAPKIFLIK